MNTKAATWEQQLADIRLTMQTARAEMNKPRPRKGRKHRGKVVPDARPADAPDLRNEERDFEQAEREARKQQAEVTRNPYGNIFYPIDQ